MTHITTPPTDRSTHPSRPALNRSELRSAPPHSESRLRLVLRLNALTSLVTGLVVAAIPDRVDDLLGTGHPGWVRVVGLGLIPFAAVCLWLSNASTDTLRRVTPDVVVADVAWVVASVVTVLLGWYSGGGIVAVLAMAAVVDTFAVLQWTGWRRLRSIH